LGDASASDRRGRRRRPTRPLKTFLPGVEILEGRLAPAIVTWTGLGTTNNWSQAANWSTGKVPTAADTVVFDGTSGKNAIVDAAFAGTVQNLDINNGYTGAVTLNHNLSMLGAFSQNAGTFAEQANTLSVASNFTSTGGTFDAGTGTLLVNSSAGGMAHAIMVNGSLTLDNLTFGDSGSGHKTYTIGSGTTLNVLGTFTMQRSSGTTTMTANGGTIAVQGNIVVGAGASGGTTDVQFAKTSQGQTYTSTGGMLPTLEVVDGMQTVSAAVGTTDLAVQNLVLTSGKLAAPTGTLTIAGNLTQTAGAVDPGSGTVLFDAGVSGHAININGAAAGLLTLNNLTFADNGAGPRIYSIGNGDGFYLRGNFTAQVQSGSTATMLVNGGIFDVVGNIALGTGYKAGTPAPRFNSVSGTTGIISGAVFNDLNGSGQEQPGDPGLSGWTVQLRDTIGNLLASTQTGSAGGYSFAGLAPGTYSVQVVPPSGWTPTVGPAGSVVVQAGADTIANFGAFQNLTLSGTAFSDRTGDGLHSAGEPPLAGWTMQLYTVSGGQISSSPLQTTTTDSLGLYSFTNLGPLPAGTSYVIAEVPPAGWTQTTPQSTTPNTLTLPNGQQAFVVLATSGIPLLTSAGGSAVVSGIGTLKLNRLNNNTVATVSFNDGAGHSGTDTTTLTQFTMTYTGGPGTPVSFDTFCIDLFHRVSVGQTFAVNPRGDLSSAFTNGSRMADIYQTYGLADLSNGPDQAAAVQLALWDLSLNNHAPTAFVKDADGTYSSGDAGVFKVSLGSNPDAAQIAALVNQYLQTSEGAAAQGGWFDASPAGSGPNRGQSVLIPESPFSFGNGPTPMPSSDEPQGTPQEAPGQAPADAVSCGPCQAPVNALTGTTMVQTPTVQSGGADPMTPALDWTNGANGMGGFNGSGIFNTNQPYLDQINGGNTIAVVTGGTDTTYFDLINGTYTPRFFSQDQLNHVSSTNQFVYTDTLGDSITFNDFSPSLPVNQRGSFNSFVDPAGNVTQVTARTADGKIAEVQRSTTVNGTTTTESFLYSFVGSGVNAGLVANLTLRRQVNGGSWETVRQANYTYYDGTQQYGNAGDLETVSIQDANGNILDTTYYRYYTAADAGTTGYMNGLKYYFSPQSYARLVAAVGNPTTATDAQVAPYADDYFQYDNVHRVTQEVVQGEGCSSCSAGLGTFTYSYATSTNPVGYNSWRAKTTETLPDSNQDIYYVNAYDQQMLQVYHDVTTGQNWETFTQYDSQGRAILEANPSAVTGYDDTKPDLLNNVNGTYQYLNDTSGLITLYDYYTTTTATETTPGAAAGYLQDSKLEQGQQGTPILQETMQYYTHTANTMTVHPLATDTDYHNTDGTAADTTTYTYTYYAGTVQTQSMTTSLPVISAAENGPGVADQSVTVYDSYGRMVWSKDADGYINYTAYDAATGAVIESITDVNTANTSDFSNLPSGWSTPAGGGLNLVTTDQVDGLGRSVAQTDPNGNVTYTVYDDVNHEVRAYPGWNAANGMPTGPTQVYREDRPGSYTEMLSMSAAPHLTNGVPDGTEPTSDVQTLSRSYTNAAGQVVRTDNYFELTGVTYSTAPYIGTQNDPADGVVGNYYTTQTAYDDRGREDRVQTPTGTIYRTVYDGLGRVVSTWVGTNDSPPSGEWSPSNNVAPSNMVQLTANVYDNGGVGDSNLTQETQYPGGSAAPRVTQQFYDWRDRLVAQKQGVQASENDGTNRPITYTTYDNINEVVQVQQYDGDSVTISTVNGEPQPPASSLLRAQTAFAYDDQGRVYQQQVFSVDPTTGAVSSTALTTNTFYDHRGDVMAQSDPGGVWTKDIYDGAGRLVVEYTTDGGGGTSWSAAGSVANDVVLQQTETVYDINDNVIETIDRQRFHDASGTGALGGPSNTTAPQARDYYTGFYYDAVDRLTATVDAGTNGGTAWVRPATAPAPSDTMLVTSDSYNAAGWLQDVVDPRGIDNRTLYDNLGRATETISDYTTGTPTNTSDHTTAYTYDGDNHVLTVQAVMPAGMPSQTTQYVYSVTTANGSALNSNDLLSATVYPDPTTGLPSTSPSQQEANTYNALGQVTSRTDRNGNTHQYMYDVLGRQTSDMVTTLGPGVDGSVRRIDTAYDSQGNPYLFTSYADTAGTTVVNQVLQTYNGLGQMTGEYQSHGGPVVIGTTPEVQYIYNDMANGENNSRLTGMIYPNGRVVNYNYDIGLDDRISRLSSISDSTGILAAYSYLGLGTVVERAHPQNSVDLTYISPTGATGDAGDQYTGLDRFGRVADQLWLNTNTGTATDEIQYAYDRNSNVLSKNNLVNPAFNEQYAYDNNNQLTSFTRGTHTQSWAYDAQGNWTSVTTDGTTQARTANAQNQYTSVSGGVTPTYDNNGNLTTDPTNGNIYVFDAWNRLVAVQNGGNMLTSYNYDALGRRIMESSSGMQTDLYYNNLWQVIEERVNSQTQTQYVWDPLASDTLVERDSNPDSNGNLALRLYAQQDANGNVTALVATSGNVVERFVYDAYGQVTVLAPDWSGPVGDAYNWTYLYQGARYETTSGLYDFRNRDYSPTLGRWLQQDPIGYAGGTMDLYQMEANNPVNRADSFGLVVKVGKDDLVNGNYGAYAVLAAQDEFYKEVLNAMIKSKDVFQVSSLAQLELELKMRKAFVECMRRHAKGMCGCTLSGDMTTEAKFPGLSGLTYTGPKPSEALDVFEKGPSRLGCYEMGNFCMWKALRDAIGPENFDARFKNKTINFKANGPDAQPGQPWLKDTKRNTILPGDFVQFFNAPFYLAVNPGGAFASENAVYEGNGLYAGFGLGTSITEKKMKEFMADDWNSGLAAYNAMNPNNQKQMVTRGDTRLGNIRRPNPGFTLP
jgi:RHS repeat-associated protein